MLTDNTNVTVEIVCGSHNSRLDKGHFITVLLVLVACIFSYSATLRMNAKNIGGGLGTGAGSIVGKAIGTCG